MSLKNVLLFVLSSVLATIAWYQIIAIIQWNWQFQTWHWACRLILIVFSIAAISKYAKEFKDEESDTNS